MTSTCEVQGVEELASCNLTASCAATIFDRIVVQFNSENNNETIIGYIDDFKLTNDTSAAATVTSAPALPL